MNEYDKANADASAQDISTLQVLEAYKVPEFKKELAETWFMQLETYFKLRRINSDETKYGMVITSIDTQTLSEIIDGIVDLKEGNKYEYVKKNIIGMLGRSTQSKLNELLSNIEMGSMKPSKLLRKMQSLAKDKVTDELLRSMFMKQLPTTISCILQVSDANLNELAKLADQMMETAQFRSVTEISDDADNKQVTVITEKAENVNERLSKIESEMKRLTLMMKKMNRRPRSQSRSRDEAECYYHQKFGDKATQCRKPCNYERKDKTEN